jgi:hypothetical protein
VAHHQATISAAAGQTRAGRGAEKRTGAPRARGSEIVGAPPARHGRFRRFSSSRRRPCGIEPIAPASDVFPSPGLCVCVSRSSSTEKPTRLAECSRLVERLNEPEAKHPSERLAGRTGKFTSSTGQSSRRVQHCSTRARPSKFISSVAG